VAIAERELRWLDRLRTEADGLPEDEGELTAEMLRSRDDAGFDPGEYGLAEKMGSRR